MPSERSLRSTGLTLAFRQGLALIVIAVAALAFGAVLAIFSVISRRAQVR